MNEKTLGQIYEAMRSVYTNIEVADEHALKSTVASVCVFYDKHIEDENYGDTLKLARDMAQDCISATTLNACKSRFTACYSVVQGIVAY